MNEKIGIIKVKQDLEARIAKQVEDVLQGAEKLVTPSFPVEWLDYQIVSEGTEALWQWLREHAPQEVCDLFNGVAFANFCRAEALENGGQITESVNEMMIESVCPTLRAIQKLGNGW